MLKNGIDPRLVTIFGVWTSVLLMVAGIGPTFFDGALPPVIATAVVKWCAIFGAINSVILTGGSAFSSPSAGPFVAKPTSFTPTVVKILLAAFALSMFLPCAAMAQAPLPRPRLPFDPLKLNDQTIAGTKATPAPDAPLPCTFQMLIRLTPNNLLSTINQCIAAKLVSDTQRALQSAQGYGGTTKGDADAVNCLNPALAIFQAGVQVPAVPEVPAVLNADGSVKTPAVPAVPAQEPGPILLYQKYREFTLSGALTSCQAWFNGPINATAAAGLGAASTAIGAAALIAPK